MSNFSENADHELLELYGPRVQGALLVPHNNKPDWSQEKMWRASLDLVRGHCNSSGAEYDAILIIRHDHIFKQPLVRLKNVEWRKVLFPWREVTSNNAVQLTSRVSDQIQWIPWRFAGCTDHIHFQCAYTGDQFRAQIGEGNVGFMFSGVHNSNTQKEANSLFKQCRPEGSTRGRQRDLP